MRRTLTVEPGGEGPRAFEELLSTNLDALYGTALRLCSGRVADAEDLLQEAMLRAFGKRGELRDPAAGRAWLFTILVRTGLNAARGRSRRAERVASDMTEEEFDAALRDWAPVSAPDQWFERAQSREHIRRALDELDANLRAVVLLTDVEGFSQREAAGILGIPEGTVASRLFRARRALRERLADVWGSEERRFG